MQQTEIDLRRNNLLGTRVCDLANRVVSPFRVEYNSAIASYFAIPRLANDPRYQSNHLWAGASHTLAAYLSEHPIQEGACMKLLTNDFKKLLPTTHLTDWIKQACIEKRAEVTVLARSIPKDISHRVTNFLEECKGHLKVLVSGSVSTEHWVIVDTPRQLWFESHHRGTLAVGCAYTDAPSSDVFRQVEQYFTSLEEDPTTRVWTP